MDTNLEPSSTVVSPMVNTDHQNQESPPSNPPVISQTQTSSHDSLDSQTTETTPQIETNSTNGTNGKRKYSDTRIKGEEIAKAKPHKRKKKRAMLAPELSFNQQEGSSDGQGFSSPTQIRSLILALKGPKNNISQLKWIKSQATEKISKVVVCLVSGLERKDLFGDQVDPLEDTSLNKPFIEFTNDTNHLSKVPFLNSTFPGAIISRTPGSKSKATVYPTFDALVNIPITKKEKAEAIALLKQRKITVNDLILTPDSRKRLGYPTPEDGYLETIEFDHEGSHIFALDCEFCTAESGSVLTRISIVNFQNDVVYDTYVKPVEKILDYVTKYSGIKPEHLEGVTTTLEDVQQKVLDMISASDILVGHSLESDLGVLKINHHNVIDTSIIYEHARGPPARPGLRWLTSTYLNRDIQLGELDGTGHSSVEDAIACLDLVKLKIIEGMHFGVGLHEVFLFNRLEAPATVIKSNNRFFCDKPEVNVLVDNDDEAVKELEARIKKVEVAIIHLTDLQRERRWKYGARRDQYEEFEVDKEADRQQLAKVDARLRKIYDVVPGNSAFIVFTDHSDPGPLNKMLSSDNYDKEEAKKLALKTRSGLTFVKVKEERKEV